MRSITVLALAAAVSGLLAVAARADDPANSTDSGQMSLKRIYQPDAKMLRAPDAGSLTPGAEKRGLQAVGPAGPATGGAVSPQHRDTPAAAAAAVTTDAARITPASAAQTIRAPSR